MLARQDESLSPDRLLAEMLRVLDRPPNGQQLARLAVQVWAEAACDRQLRERLSSYYHQLRERFEALARRYQRHGTVRADVGADHVAQVLMSMGPAFLAQRALLDDVSAETYASGLSGLLAAPGPSGGAMVDP